MTGQGIATVARQEFTIRIRAGRWRLLLAAWFVVLALLTWLMTRSLVAFDGEQASNRGVVVYGGLVLLVLAIALLLVPSLSSQSINGDREHGTLATLQVTRLSAGDIAVGKLVAAWGTSLVFLFLTVPLIGYCMVLGGVRLSTVAVATVVVALLLGVVASLALCLSALLSRSTTSGVLAYLTVFGLTVGTLIAFGIGTALSTEDYTGRTPGFCTDEEGRPTPIPSGSPLPDPIEGKPGLLPDGRFCQREQTFQGTRSRVDRVWWLLAPNPFVILADAAPQLPPLTEEQRRKRQELIESGAQVRDLRDQDPLGALGREIRGLRQPPTEGPEEFFPYGPQSPQVKEPPRKMVWPYGLAFDVLLAAGALWLATRRLRTPTRNLPRGQRVA